HLHNLDILLPYYCDPKVEIGRFQNTAVEINQDYVDAHDIQVMRRETGGGAVYVDRGAVNMCCLLQNDNSIYGDFQKFYEPAINALHHLGATEVVQSGRNDLEINGKKVSGAAMRSEEHTSELQSRFDLVCRLLLEKKK